MKFKTPQHALTERVTVARRTMQSGPQQIPSHTGILIEADKSKAGGTVTFTAANSEQLVHATMPADVIEGGAALLSGKLFGDIVRALPDTDVVVQMESKNKVRITAGDGSDFRLQTRGVEDFQPLDVGALSKPVVLDAQALSEAIGQIAPCCGRDSARPILTGMYLDPDPDNGWDVVGTDSYRLGIRAVEVGLPSKSAPLNVPVNGMEEAARLMRGHDAVEVRTSKQGISFTVDSADDVSTQLLCKLLVGDYPDYKKLLPEKVVGPVKVLRGGLAESTQRIALITSETGSAMKVRFKSGRLELSASSAEIGKGVEKIAAEFKPNSKLESFDQGLNPSFLLDALRSFNTETLTMSNFLVDAEGNAKPVLITSEDQPDLRHLLMPVRT